MSRISHVDLAGRAVEVYSKPTKSTYGKPRVYNAGSKLPIELAGRKIGAIPVVDIFP
jgi:hypothetical protein